MLTSGAMTMTDDLTATLDQIRERARVAGEDQQDGVALWIGALGASQEDVPLLLKAIEAVLKLADEAQGVRDYSGYETNGRLVGWNLNPAKVREAITAELAKGESSHA